MFKFQKIVSNGSADVKRARQTRLFTQGGCPRPSCEGGYPDGAGDDERKACDEVFVIGSAVEEGDVMSATKDGFECGLKI